jgi:hypothetical protein
MNCAIHPAPAMSIRFQASGGECERGFYEWTLSSTAPTQGLTGPETVYYFDDHLKLWQVAGDSDTTNIVDVHGVGACLLGVRALREFGPDLRRLYHGEDVVAHLVDDEHLVNLIVRPSKRPENCRIIGEITNTYQDRDKLAIEEWNATSDPEIYPRHRFVGRFAFEISRLDALGVLKQINDFFDVFGEPAC